MLLTLAEEGHKEIIVIPDKPFERRGCNKELERNTSFSKGELKIQCPQRPYSVSYQQGIPITAGPNLVQSHSPH